jgi:universal stress protein A
MNRGPVVLCPLDFSPASRVALQYATAIAERLKGRLVILAVADPLFAEAVALGTGAAWSPDETRDQLVRFAAEALADSRLPAPDVEYAVTVGKPARQILQIARETACHLIVMSTHGVTGARKRFFGATTERVLRETTVPVLATPPGDTGPYTFEDIRRRVGRVLVPVDLSDASRSQVQIGRRIAEMLRVPFVVTSVVEPVRSPGSTTLHLPSIELERRTRAEDLLARLATNVPGDRPSEALVAYGDPAEEIAKIARDRQAGLIVMGLEGSPLAGTHMGSVTYRVLCLVPALVLALPPGVSLPQDYETEALPASVSTTELTGSWSADCSNPRTRA